MNHFDRRSFLKLVGQGTAALTMTLPSEFAWAQKDSETSKSRSPKGKYQIFYPGEYLDWERKVIDERLTQVKENARRAAEGTQGMDRPSVIVSEAELLKYNKAWDPYNPLFNDKKYAQRAGYPDIPAFPCFQRPRGGSVSGIPRDMADLWYYANDGGDAKVWTHVFAGDTFFSETDKLVFEELTVPGSDLRHFLTGGSGYMYNDKGEQVGWAYSNTRQGYRKIVDGSLKPNFTENMSEWCEYFPEAHYTTREEWEYIRDLWEKEYIRGSQKLYWEDVNIGDEPAWICTGPITYMDLIYWHGGSNEVNRETLKNCDFDKVFQDQYGQVIGNGGIHYGSRNIPGMRAIPYNHTCALHLTRLVTNYIGDAGLVTRVCWKFKQLFKEMQVEKFQGGEFLDKVPHMKGKTCTVHPSEGDTVIGKGYVTDKYINDRGEYTIDLTCWAETLDDRIIQVVGISAKLPSKKG